MASDLSRTLRGLQADGAGPAWLAWGAAAMLGAAWLLWFAAGRVTLYESAVTARIEAQNAAHPLALPFAGTLLRSSLALGREVRAGEVLLELDNRVQALALQEEQARLAALPQRRAALRAEAEATSAEDSHAAQAAEQALAAARQRAGEAVAAAAFAREHAVRLAAEVAGGGVAEIDALRARSEAERLAAQVQAANAEAKRLVADGQTGAARGVARQATLRGQLAQLKAEAAARTATVQRLQAEIERSRLRAPVDGVLAEVQPLQAGSWVAEGRTVATVLARGGLLMVADFAPQRALGRLQPGQAARVRLDSLPWVEHGSLPAHVRQVASELREGHLRVELALDGPAAGQPPAHPPLSHGQSGSVEVAVEQVSPWQLLLRTLGARLAR